MNILQQRERRTKHGEETPQRNKSMYIPCHAKVNSRSNPAHLLHQGLLVTVGVAGEQMHPYKRNIDACGEPLTAWCNACGHVITSVT